MDLVETCSEEKLIEDVFELSALITDFIDVAIRK